MFPEVQLAADYRNPKNKSQGTFGQYAIKSGVLVMLVELVVLVALVVLVVLVVWDNQLIIEW